MHPIKYIWAIRAIIYKPFFKKIGKYSYIGKPCFIEGGKNISIGERTRIFPGIRMETLKNGEIFIGDNCAIEQNVHITSMNSILKIGKDVTVLANTYITNIEHEYGDINRSVLEQDIIYRETEIKEGCFIGYGAAIQAGTILGKHCIVGAHSVVRGIFPDYCVIVGTPGKIIKKYNHETKKWERVYE